ncbi:MAG: anthranilate synthase component II [Planctomycetota bacterium]
MILIIDNYDSFTYNLVQRLGELGAEVEVRRNDRITIERVREMDPDRIIISPGPCTPAEAGISVDLIREFAGTLPLLGVCLGHQCISAAMGGEVVRHRRLMHGKTSMITHDGKTIYRGLPNPFEATRYHSLSVPEDTLPDCFEVSARAEADEVMGIRHRQYPLEGVQFHPESFLTTEGPGLLENFLRAEIEKRSNH